MRVLRGRAPTLAADRETTDALLDRVADAGDPALRVWYPDAHVAFGRRDASAAGYDRARAIAANRGYPPCERAVGGHAVAFTGDVLAFVHAEPADAAEPAIDERYERASETLVAAFHDLDVEARSGEPPDSFCPGTHSLRTDDGKVAGLAQRVRRDVAVVAGVVIVDDVPAVASVLDPVYDALDVPFDPDSVGSLAGAIDGAADPGTVREAIEAAFVGNRTPTVRTVRDT